MPLPASVTGRRPGWLNVRYAPFAAVPVLRTLNV